MKATYRREIKPWGTLRLAWKIYSLTSQTDVQKAKTAAHNLWSSHENLADFHSILCFYRSSRLP